MVAEFASEDGDGAQGPVLPSVEDKGDEIVPDRPPAADDTGDDGLCFGIFALTADFVGNDCTKSR